MPAVEPLTDWIKTSGQSQDPTWDRHFELERLRASYPELDACALGRIDSTNEALKRLLRQPGAEAFGPLLLVADRQTAGRGRGRNSWYADAGASLLFTASFPLAKPEPLVPLLAALTVYETVSEHVPGAEAELELKWPNDVLWRGGKLAGILCEAVLRPSGSHLLIGIGINIQEQELPLEAGHASSLEAIAASVGRSAPRGTRGDLLQACYARLYTGLQMLGTPGGTTRLLQAYKAKLGTLGQLIRWRSPEGEARGIVRDVSEQGYLLVEDAQGRREELMASEIREVRHG